MEVGIVAICFIAIAYDLNKNRNLCSPLVLFCGLWGFITILGALQLFGFSGYSEEAIVSVFLGVTGFAVGSILASHISFENRLIKRLSGGKVANYLRCLTNNSINMLYLKVLLSFVGVGVVFSLIYSLYQLANGVSYVDIRGAFLGYTDVSSFYLRLLVFFNSYFVGPALTALLPIALVFRFKGINIAFSHAVLLCLLGNMISSGGRITIIYALLQALACFFLFKVRVTKKLAIQIGLVFLLCLTAVITLTMLRSSGGIVLSTYSYFTAPLGILSRLISMVEDSGFQSFGAAFVYPLFYIANTVSDLINLEIPFLKQLVYYVALPQDTWFSGIIPGRTFNAFASLFYFFYLDYRMIGILALSGVFGAFVSIVFNKATRINDNKAIANYLLMIQPIVGSFIIWYLGGTKFWLSVVLFGLAYFDWAKINPFKLSKKKQGLL